MYSGLERQLSAVAVEVSDLLSQLLPVAEDQLGFDRLVSAMRYSTLAAGKRIRPFLTVESAALFNADRQGAMHAAAAIELIHNYSLIHDDLPALDNDDWRRGSPSCHKQFDEATAILAGDALLTYAFEVLSDMAVHIDPMVRLELIRSTARAAGFRGMVGGQMMDLLSEHQQLSIVEIIRLQRLKTGELFLLSCEAGAILGRAPMHLRKALSGYAGNIGLAFQINDDLLDFKGGRQATGKMVVKDQSKANLAAVWGVERCQEHIATLAQQAIDYLAPFAERANILRDLAKFLVAR